MKLLFFAVFTLLSVLSNTLYAQLDDNVKAKLYFTEAEKLFKQGDFKGSLGYVEKAENTLGSKVARTMALKIKIAYNLGEFVKAKEMFDDYTNNYMKSASEELNDEVLKLFIDIEEGVEAEKKRLYITVNGRKLEVTKEDLGRMTWHDAKNACSRIGTGWRLPTLEELEQMHLQLYKYGIGNFNGNSFWSSKEGRGYADGSDGAWIFDMKDGSANCYWKANTPNVRAVRAL